MVVKGERERGSRASAARRISILLGWWSVAQGGAAGSRSTRSRRLRAWGEPRARLRRSSAGLTDEDAAALGEARAELLGLRSAVREALGAAAAGRTLPAPALAELNRASRAAPGWFEVDPRTRRVRRRSLGSRSERVLATYARSALELVADEESGLRVCPAPSCGMFYRPRRSDQRWCSHQCGSRARFVRHYRSKRES